jgi:UDP-N-acetylmuramoyl-tripeptide--D-alanyl-D-alanine ligase
MVSVEQLYNIYRQNPEISTDTRKITTGCIFFALKGENFDANAFADAALESGAAYAVVDDPSVKKTDRHLLVPDVLRALQDLAAYHRGQLTIPFIGITGTNGKTTTKELVLSVLSQRYKAFATQGNLNNHIGVPLTVLSIGPETEIAIIEMGANHQKEIEFLCGIARPEFGLITNVGKAHLEGFGGFEGVKIAKGELYQFLARNNGTVFLNADNPHLTEMSKQHQVQKSVRYGSGPDNYISGNLKTNAPLVIEWHKGAEASGEVQAHLTGTYNFENILAAITIGGYFGLTPEEINAGISSYIPTNNRSQIKNTGRNTIICDYYNANPSSMSLALDNLISTDTEKKAFILGDMFELGPESESEHRQIIGKALAVNAVRKIFVGKEFLALKISGGEFYETVQEALQGIKDHPIRDTTVLVKGSRGMKLETLVDQL